MAEEDKNSEDTILSENQEKNDASELDENAEPNEEKSEPVDADISGTRPGSKIKSILIVFLIVSVFAGLAVYYLPVVLNNKNVSRVFADSMTDAGDDLQENDLSPFFIPPSKMTKRRAIRIDLSVVWNGLASIRFKNRKIYVRNSLYGYLKELAEKNEDLNSLTPVMETEMSRIFQESLGVNGLTIIIKEIRYI